MISFEHQISGGQIASALAFDAEEIAYFFKAWIEDLPDDIMADVAGFLDATERQEVAALLTLLAEQIGGAA